MRIHIGVIAVNEDVSAAGDSISQSPQVEGRAVPRVWKSGVRESSNRRRRRSGSPCRRYRGGHPPHSRYSPSLLRLHIEHTLVPRIRRRASNPCDLSHRSGCRSIYLYSGILRNYRTHTSTTLCPGTLGGVLRRIPGRNCNASRRRRHRLSIPASRLGSADSHGSLSRHT